MARAPWTRLTRLLLAVWFAAGGLFPAALHPCHAHDAASPAPAQHVQHHASHQRTPAPEVPHHHQCDCVRDCCCAAVATIARTPATAAMAEPALVATVAVFPTTLVAPQPAASHRQPPAIGPPLFLI